MESRDAQRKSVTRELATRKALADCNVDKLSTFSKKRTFTGRYFYIPLALWATRAKMSHLALIRCPIN